MDSVKDKNSEIKDIIKNMVDDSSWGLYYEGIELYKIKENKLTFSCSSFVKEIIKTWPYYMVRSFNEMGRLIYE